MLVLSFAMPQVLPVYAGFQLEDSDIPENLEFEILEKQEIGTEIKTFAISEQNWTAVGFSNECISIYDENCDPVIHFTIDTSGGVYYLEWQERDLCIHIVRGDKSVRISQNGEIISYSHIPDTDENRAYWRSLTERATITVNGLTYYKSGNRLIQTAEDGTKNVIVSTEKQAREVHLTFILLVFCAFLLFVIIFVICVSERKGKADEKDYPLTLRGFMQIRSDLLKDHQKQTENYSHSPKTYDELYTTRKEDYYENN